MKAEELLKGLSREQLEKARSCKDNEELLKLAQEEGIELSDDQLEAVNGGCGENQQVSFECPICGSSDVLAEAGWDRNSRDIYKCHCNHCGHNWEAQR